MPVRSIAAAARGDGAAAAAALLRVQGGPNRARDESSGDHVTERVGHGVHGEHQGQRAGRGAGRAPPRRAGWAGRRPPPSEL